MSIHHLLIRCNFVPLQKIPSTSAYALLNKGLSRKVLMPTCVANRVVLAIFAVVFFLAASWLADARFVGLVWGNGAERDLGIVEGIED